MSYPDNSARSSLQRERQSLIAIEQLLDTVNLRQLTEDNIYRLENDLRRIIVEIREAPIEYFESKEAVLANLRKASDQLNTSLELSGKKGKTIRFYEALRKCQAFLEDALRHW